MLRRLDEVIRAIESMAGVDATVPLALLLVQVERLREVHALFDDDFSDACATRLGQALRADDQLFRIGEHSYALLLPEVSDEGLAQLAAARIVRLFAAPLRLQNQQQVMVQPRIGIALAPRHARSAAALCHAGELAFARGLRRRIPFALYDERDARLELPYLDLEQAIAHNRLAVHLQPVLAVSERRLVGAESLARWHSAELGQVRPDDFILLAERTGLISALTRWSLNNTLRYAAKAHSAGHLLRFSINLSPRVFVEAGIVESLCEAMAIWSVPAEAVTFEVTESAVMEDPETSASVLRRLRDHGFGISIDDFGIGFSSFSYLKRFPATELKIDQMFVTDISSDDHDARLTEAMIEVAHRLGLKAVAEGVENADTLYRLAEMGCDYAQGWHIGRPQAAAEFIASLSSTESRPA